MVVAGAPHFNPSSEPKLASLGSGALMLMLTCSWRSMLLAVTGEKPNIQLGRFTTVFIEKFCPLSNFPCFIDHMVNLLHVLTSSQTFRAGTTHAIGVGRETTLGTLTLHKTTITQTILTRDFLATPSTMTIYKSPKADLHSNFKTCEFC